MAKWAKFFEVSTSGYYEWKATRTAKTEREAKYREEVRSIFVESDGTYGAERIGAKMRKAGHTASFAKAKRAMNDMSLRSSTSAESSR